MAQLVTIRYYEESSKQWGMRRPAVPTPLPKSYSLVSINLGGRLAPLTAADRARALGQLLQNTSPALIAFQEMQQDVYSALLGEDWVRRAYGATELLTFPGLTTNVDGAVITLDHGCAFLVKHGVNVDFGESLAKAIPGATPKPVVALHMRQFLGAGSHTFATAHMDPTASIESHARYVQDVFDKIGGNDTVALTGNFYHTTAGGDAGSKEARASIAWAIGNGRHAVRDLVDAAAPPGSELRELESSVWGRLPPGGRHALDVRPLAARPELHRGVYRSAVLLAFQHNPQAAAAAAAASAGAGATQSPAGTPVGGTSPAAGGPSSFVDPAVLHSGTSPAAGAGLPAGSAAAANRSGNNTSSNNNNNSAAGPGGWTLRQSLNVRGRPLSAEEQPYDVSSRFASAQDAVDALNSGVFAWPADYAIVHGTLLAIEHAPCQATEFRRYAQAHANPWALLQQQLSGGAAVAVPAPRSAMKQQQQHLLMKTDVGVDPRRVVGGGAARGNGAVGSGASPPPTENDPYGSPGSATTAPAPAPAVPAQSGAAPVSRLRLWSEAHCSIQFQVSPKEMRFDVTPEVGMNRGNLVQAIHRLNTNAMRRPAADGSKADPSAVGEYKYDYALLYCPEKHGYWLIAASDVPCDIAACRLAAG